MNIDKLVKCFEKEIEFFELIVTTAKATVTNNKDEEIIELMIIADNTINVGTFTYKQAIESDLDEKTFAYVIFQSFVQKTIEFMFSDMTESEDK